MQFREIYFRDFHPGENKWHAKISRFTGKKSKIKERQKKKKSTPAGLEPAIFRLSDRPISNLGYCGRRFCRPPELALTLSGV